MRCRQVQAYYKALRSQPESLATRCLGTIGTAYVKFRTGDEYASLQAFAVNFFTRLPDPNAFPSDSNNKRVKDLRQKSQSDLFSDACSDAPVPV